MLAAGDERTSVTETRIAELEKRAPRLAISGKLPKDAIVRRDGEEIPAAKIGLAAPVDAGGHIVLVVRPGKPDRRFDVVLQEGERRELDVSEPAAGPPPVVASAEPARRPPPPTTTASAGEPSTKETPTVAYALLGIGVAGLLTSAVTGAMALGKKSTMSAHCNGAVQCDQEGLDAASAGKTLSTISTIGFGVGLVGAGLGSYFLFTTDDKKTALRGHRRGAYINEAKVAAPRPARSLLRQAPTGIRAAAR